MPLDLTLEETTLIADAMETFLESFHVSQDADCRKLTACPVTHFDLMTPDVVRRQAVLKKLNQAIKRWDRG